MFKNKKMLDKVRRFSKKWIIQHFPILEEEEALDILYVHLQQENYDFRRRGRFFLLIIQIKLELIQINESFCGSPKASHKLLYHCLENAPFNICTLWSNPKLCWSLCIDGCNLYIYTVCIQYTSIMCEANPVFPGNHHKISLVHTTSGQKFLWENLTIDRYYMTHQKIHDDFTIVQLGVRCCGAGSDNLNFLYGSDSRLNFSLFSLKSSGPLHWFG